MLCKLYKDHLQVNTMQIIDQQTKSIKNNFDIMRNLSCTEKNGKDKTKQMADKWQG